MVATLDSAALCADAGWLAQAFDPAADTVRLVRMDEAGYRAASFLDDRMLTAETPSAIVRWGDLAAALAGATRDDAAWIFHIGHVGSTLASRMLGELPEFLSIREPRLLRDLATMTAGDWAERAGLVQRLYSRSFRADQRAIVKATSYTSQMADRLPAPGAAVIAMYAAPKAFIEGILAGPASTAEIQAMAPMRRRRLEALGWAPLADGSSANPALLAADAWVCEMATLERAAAQRPDAPVLWADFDSALPRMGDWLVEAARHLGGTSPDEEIRAVGNGPLLHRYSKASQYDYSPDLRRALLVQAWQEHGPAIRNALDALARQAGNHPLITRALDRASRED